MRDAFDKIGGGSFIVGIMLSVNKWLSKVDYSHAINVLTVVSLAIGIVYFMMRIYHQYLETKKFKRDKDQD